MILICHRHAVNYVCGIDPNLAIVITQDPRVCDVTEANKMHQMDFSTLRFDLLTSAHSRAHNLERRVPMKFRPSKLSLRTLENVRS